MSTCQAPEINIHINWPLVMTMLRTLVDVINSNPNQSCLGMLRFHGTVVRGDEPGVAWIHEYLSLSSNADLAGGRSAIDELANETQNTYIFTR